MRFKRPSAASIIAFMALFVALAGSAYAAAKITSSDIKNGTIKTVDMSSSAKRALKGNTGPRGAQGPQGIPGPQGPAGPSAVARVTRVEATVTVQPGDTQFAIAFCPSGMSAIGGGYTAIMGSGSEVWSNARTASGLGWAAHSWNLNEFVAGDLTVEAYCAPTGVAVAAGVNNTRTTDRRAEAKKQRAKRAVDTK